MTEEAAMFALVSREDGRVRNGKEVEFDQVHRAGARLDKGW